MQWRVPIFRYVYVYTSIQYVSTTKRPLFTVIIGNIHNIWICEFELF